MWGARFYQPDTDYVKDTLLGHSTLLCSNSSLQHKCYTLRWSRKFGTCKQNRDFLGSNWDFGPFGSPKFGTLLVCLDNLRNLCTPWNSDFLISVGRYDKLRVETDPQVKQHGEVSYKIHVSKTSQCCVMHGSEIFWGTLTKLWSERLLQKYKKS